MYVCCKLQECNYVFYACAHRHHGHALAGLAALPADKARMKFEAQRLAKLREGERTLDVGGGETEDDAERKQRPTRMRNYARSRREAEDGSPWLSGRKRPFTHLIVFSSATVYSIWSRFLKQMKVGWLGTPFTPSSPWSAPDMMQRERRGKSRCMDTHAVITNLNYLHTAPWVNYTMCTPSIIISSRSVCEAAISSQIHNIEWFIEIAAGCIATYRYADIHISHAATKGRVESVCQQHPQSAAWATLSPNNSNLYYNIYLK